MSDIIRREDALLTLKIFDYDIIPSAFARQYVREMLDTLYVKLNEIPSAERKKGEWIVTSEFEDCRYVKCNQCKVTQVFYYNKPLTNFCPNCGAEMTRGDR